MSKYIKSVILCMLAAFLFTTTAPLSTPASAETLTWQVKSRYPHQVELKFYEKRGSKVKRYWPGTGKVYVLRDSAVHEYTLRCNDGAKICYGAWVRGKKTRYWGVGYRGRKACKNCCYTCNGGVTPVRTLKR